MKTTAKKLMLTFGIALSITTQAQENKISDVSGSDYNNAVGLRLGFTSGLTFKHKFGPGHAAEFIFSSGPYALGVTGLYEKNIGTKITGLNCYLGAGAHFNMGGARRAIYRYYNDVRYTYVYGPGYNALGIDGVMGIEYKFKPIPFALSLDMKPFFEINNYGYGYFALDPSLGIKLAF